MTETLYTVDISGDGVSIKREVPKDVGDEIIVLMLTGSTTGTVSGTTKRQASAATPTMPVSPLSPEDEGGQSIREALDASGAKRSPDKITVIGDYVKRTEGKDFSRDDLVSMFEAAAEKVPANLARDVKWTLKAGWIAERNGQKGKYYVTNTGKQALRATFSKEFVKKTRGFTSGVGKKSSAKNESKD